MAESLVQKARQMSWPPVSSLEAEPSDPPSRAFKSPLTRAGTVSVTVKFNELVADWTSVAYSVYEVHVM